MPEEQKRHVSPAEAFEILCADCLRTEPFPREIQIIGQAIGWFNLMHAMAAKRGMELDIQLKPMVKECPGHTALPGNSKICKHCGEHVETA